MPTLAGLVEARDRFATPLATVAGFCVGLDGGSDSLRAAAVLLDATTLEVLATRVVHLQASSTPGEALRAERASEVMQAALAALPRQPDLAFVDGHGTAHPDGFGPASHFGVASGVPSIGVAGDVVTGSGPEPHQTRGAYTALRDHRGRQLGWLLRSRQERSPVVVSPGHRVALASAADLVMRYTRDGRFPEPVRLAAAVLSEPSEGTDANQR